MRGWRSIRDGLAVVAIVLAGACSGSESANGQRCQSVGCAGPGSDDTLACVGGCWKPTAEDEAYAHELCLGFSGCCSRLHDPRFTPVPTEADHVARCSEFLLQDSFSRDASLHAACLDQAKQAASTSACLPEIWPPDPASACARLISEPSGPTPVGGRCGAKGDCASKPGSVAWCGAPTGTTPYCQLWERGKAGDACVVTFTGSFLAVPVPTTELVGPFCATEDGLACLPVDAPEARCRALLPDGADCLWPFVCASHVCTAVPGSSWGRCGPASEPHDLPDGSSCTDHEGCHSGRCLNGTCVSESFSASAFQLCAQ